MKQETKIAGAIVVGMIAGSWLDAVTTNVALDLRQRIDKYRQDVKGERALGVLWAMKQEGTIWFSESTNTWCVGRPEGTSIFAHPANHQTLTDLARDWEE